MGVVYLAKDSPTKNELAGENEFMGNETEIRRCL